MRFIVLNKINFVLTHLTNNICYSFGAFKTNHIQINQVLCNIFDTSVTKNHNFVVMLVLNHFFEKLILSNIWA